MPDEIRHLLNFVLEPAARTSGWTTSTWSCPPGTSGTDKFIGSDEQWEVATAVLEEVAGETGLELVPDPGGAAFYGPKISVQARDAIGRTWQMSTIQYDFNQPERFELEYSAADGTRQRPVMIHSAMFGSIERFIGVLTEHYAGAFPVWLAPVQVVGIPVADAFGDHLEAVAQGVARQGDPGRGRPLRRPDAEEDPQPHHRRRCRSCCWPAPGTCEADAVSFRFRDGSQVNGVPVTTAIEAIADWVARRENASPTAENLGFAAPADAERRRRRRRWKRRRCGSAVTRSAHAVAGPSRATGSCRTGSACPTAWPGCGRRTGWPTSPRRPGPRRARTDPGAGTGLPVLPDPDAAGRARADRAPGARMVYAVLNLYPYNPGHLMVVPFRHIPDYTDAGRRRGRRVQPSSPGMR